MQFPTPLIKGTLVKRYKRFLADVTLEDGSLVTAHCANSGSMQTVKEPESEVWLSHHDDPKRKLKYTWELIKVGEAYAGVNTGYPNKVAAEAIAEGLIPDLSGYASQRREVKYGKNSRIDILLEDPNRPLCYVEVKNVTLKRSEAADGVIDFPDAVTSRGAKHLVELSDMVAQGHRAVMLYFVQRSDGGSVSIAEDIDPTYAQGVREAMNQGVEIHCVGCAIDPQSGISVNRTLPFVFS
ncbi:MAG: DNA/RNA nuclease SfsA [Rhodospirillaceae bacterium]